MTDRQTDGAVMRGAPTVVEPDGRGHWIVRVPGTPVRRFEASTLSAAERYALEHGGREIVVRDVYHRVVAVRRRAHRPLPNAAP